MKSEGTAKRQLSKNINTAEKALQNHNTHPPLPHMFGYATVKLSHSYCYEKASANDDHDEAVPEQLAQFGEHWFGLTASHRLRHAVCFPHSQTHAPTSPAISPLLTPVPSITHVPSSPILYTITIHHNSTP